MTSSRSKAALPVYELLGAADHFRTSIRPDKHIGWIQVERYLDWFDIALDVGGVGNDDGADSGMRHHGADVGVGAGALAGAGRTSTSTSTNLLELERSFPQKMLYNFSWVSWNRSLTVEGRRRALTLPLPTAGAMERVLWGLGNA